MGKLMNYAGAAYDPVVMRWYYGNTELYAKTSEVFKKGYEDPTYMTFRVEFGEWGASVLPKNMFSAHNYYTIGIGHLDYDQLPNGLMDLHFAEDMLKQYPNYSFNGLNYYNAYNYLLLRNEDTRAEYLKAFVIGLYEILKEHPYLFLSISGLDALGSFNPESGLRLLKDTFITIECIEGLSLKIRTLLELYRKAAWDDVWQRWVLPLNMRQFKMIIYIFERRTFQKINPYTNTKTRHVVNLDVPVYAYECNPCEFVINNIWNGERSANWDNSDAEKTKITIRVNNVMTYYRNGLLESKLGNILIYDLLDAMDRSKGTNIIDTRDDMLSYSINTTKGNFLKKQVLLENEDMNVYSPTLSEQIFYGLPEDDDTDPMVTNYLKEITNSLNKNSLLGERIKANWWHEATVEGRDYWSGMSGWDGLFGGGTWRNIGKGLWNIITAATTQIRVSLNYSTHNSTVFYNILDYIDFDDEGFSLATLHPFKPNNELKWNADDKTRKEFSWATREKGYGKFSDQSNHMDTIDSDALTEGDFSWATDDKNAENNHDWQKFKDNPNKRQKSEFNWKGLDSSLMTGGDFSWATTDYTATGAVKGNDWTNSAQYRQGDVPRQKNGFNWNSIDSKAMTGDDFSWATNDANNPTDHKWEDFDADHMEDNQRQKQAFIWNSIDSKKLSENEISKATKADQKIQESIDTDKLTEHDFSWATKGEGDKEHDSHMKFTTIENSERNTIDTKQAIQSGIIDSEILTNHDYSWATKDSNNDYDHSVVIHNGKMDSSLRDINDNILIAIDEERLLPDIDLLTVDDKKRKQNNNVKKYDTSTNRGFNDIFLQTTYNDREINNEMPPLISLEKELNEFQLNSPSDTLREINDNIDVTISNEREIKNNIQNNLLHERKINKPKFDELQRERNISNAQFSELDSARTINTNIQMELIEERNIPEAILKEPTEPRNIDNNIVGANYKARTINQDIQIGEFTDRNIKDGILVEVPEERKVPEFKNNQNYLQPRAIIDLALKQPDLPKAKSEHSLVSLDTHQRGINDESYFSLHNTERYIDNSIQTANYEERIIKDTPMLDISKVARTQADTTMDTLDHKERILPQYKVNRLDIINYISKATNAAFNVQFKEIDLESGRIDATAAEMLKNASAFKSLLYDESMKNNDDTMILAFAKAYSDESEAMKKAFIARITGLLKELKEQTLKVVRDIPEMEFQEITEADNNKQEPILLTVELTNQIKDNVKLISLADAEVRDLSYKGLISLHNSLENNIVKTMIMQKPETVNDRSIATDLDNPPKPIINGKVEGSEKPEKPILNGTMEDNHRHTNNNKNISNSKVEDNHRHTNNNENISNSKVDQNEKKSRPLLGHRIDRVKK